MMLMIETILFRTRNVRLNRQYIQSLSQWMVVRHYYSTFFGIFSRFFDVTGTNEQNLWLTVTDEQANDDYYLTTITPCYLCGKRRWCHTLKIVSPCRGLVRLVWVM